MRPFDAYAQNVYSQNGEDGIIQELLNRLGDSITLSGWCVEFGAWDGIHLSNTCHLIRDRGYNAVLIEGSRQRFLELELNFPEANVHKINRFVAFDGEDCLDHLLALTPVPAEFDVLSIDIDGCDYWILASLRNYSPRIIVIEFNPTIPNEVEYVQPRDFSMKRGASALSLILLANSMGLRPVAVTSCNIVFVRSDLLPALGIDPADTPHLHHLRDDSQQVSFAFSGYDGALLLSKPISLPWHGIRADAKRMQPLPRLFRTFPADWGRFRSVSWNIWRLIRKAS